MVTIKKSHFRWIIVGLLFFILIINFIDRAALSLVLPYVQAEFNFSTAQLGYILGVFSIGYLITAFVGGILLDKFGPKTIFIVAGIMGISSLLLITITTTFTSFLLVRFLLGLASGPVFPALTIAAKRWLPVKERSTALSFIIAASTIGLVLSAPIVTYLTYYLAWKGMFISLGLASAIWIPLWIYLFKNFPQDSRFVNQYEIEHITGKNEQAQNNIDENYQSVSRLSTLANKTILANIWGNIVFCFFFYFYISWLPTYLNREYKVDSLIQGIIIFIVWSGATISILCGGPICDFIYRKTHKLRYARSYPIMVSILISAFCIMILSLNHLSLQITTILLTIAVSFTMLSAPIYYAVNLDVVKVNPGFPLGVMEASSSIAGFVAAVITGYLVHASQTFNSIFIFLAILAAINTIVIYLFHKPDC